MPWRDHTKTVAPGIGYVLVMLGMRQRHIADDPRTHDRAPDRKVRALMLFTSPCETSRIADK